MVSLVIAIFSFFLVASLLMLADKAKEETHIQGVFVGNPSCRKASTFSRQTYKSHKSLVRQMPFSMEFMAVSYETICKFGEKSIPKKLGLFMVEIKTVRFLD